MTRPTITILNAAFCFVLALFMTLSSYAQPSLKTRIAAISRKVNGNFGFSAMVLETGDSTSFNGDRRFPMQSVYKLPIAMAVLDAVDNGTLKIDQIVHVEKSDFIPMAGVSPIRDKFPDGADMTIRELLRYNIMQSDGTACDVLLRVLGGTGKVDQFMHDLGVRDIAIATTEKIQVPSDSVQYQNWTTPKGMTKFLEIFYTTGELSKSSRDLLLNDMIQSGPGAKRIKGLLPSGTIVAHKTGTSGTINGLTRATNDVGIITLPNGNHLAIAVFISDSYDSHADRELSIAEAAKAAFGFWKEK